MNPQLQYLQQMVAQRQWVRTPWQYSTLGAGLSLIQQQALLMVSDSLQTYIKQFYDLHLARSRESPKCLFTDHVLQQGLPPFRIWLQDLGITPSNYDAARKAIDEINLQVEHQEFDSDGQPTGRTIRTNVFSQFGFESSGDFYHFRDEQGREQVTERMNPYIDVKINPDVAMWAFDMSKGYVNHLKMIALYSSKRPTPRIYMLLMRAMTKADHTKELRVPLAELKDYLGIRPYKDKQGNTVTPYPMFSNFRQKVLDAVRDDLNRMAAQNPPTTDITFTYDPIYPGARRKGDPDAILFHITRTLLGDAYSYLTTKPAKGSVGLFTTAPVAPAPTTRRSAASAAAGYPIQSQYIPAHPSNPSPSQNIPAAPVGSVAPAAPAAPAVPVAPAAPSAPEKTRRSAASAAPVTPQYPFLFPEYPTNPSPSQQIPAATTWHPCAAAIKSSLALTGADVWLDRITATADGTPELILKYDRTDSDKILPKIRTEKFITIIRQYFGQDAVISLREGA